MSGNAATPYIIIFELLSVCSIVVVLWLLRLGVHGEKYAAAHGEAEIQRERRRIAKDAELRYWREHPMTGYIMSNGRGVVLWMFGLLVVVVSSADSSTSHLIRYCLVAVGLTIQVIALVWYNTCGLMAARGVARAVREQSP